MISVKFDEAALLAKLQALSVQLVDIVRPAAQVGSQMLYEEVKQRAPVSTKEHSTKGKRITFQPGHLKDSIYQAYSQANSSATVATYQISYNKKKAFYGRFVEFGTVKIPARPFVRPSFDAVGAQAAQAAKAKYLELAKEAINGR